MGLESAGSGVLVDVDALDVEHLGKVFPVFGSDVVREGAVVSTTGENPCAGTNLERWLRNPKGGSNRELTHWLWLNALYFRGDETETVTKVYNSSLDTTTSLRSEHEACSLLLTDTDAKEVYLKGGLVDSDERTNLEHVALEAGCAVRSEVEGVVLEERTALLHTLVHNPQRTVETCSLPVTLGTKTNTLGHEALRGETWYLVETDEVRVVDVCLTKVIEVGSEGCGALFLQYTT